MLISKGQKYKKYTWILLKYKYKWSTIHNWVESQPQNPKNNQNLSDKVKWTKYIYCN